MNLINYSKQTVSDNIWKVMSDFREMDHSKLKPILQNMLNNIQELLGKEFKYDISVSSYTSDYLAEKATYYDAYNISMKFGEHKQDIKFFYPKLIKGNCYIMYGSLYIPLVFLERAPIDVFQTAKVKKITVSLMPTFTFNFVFQKNQVYIKRRAMHMNTFFRVLFEEDAYYESLINDKIISRCPQKTFADAKKYVIKMMDFYNDDYFENNPDIKVSDIFDKYILLDYFKGMFYDFYGINNIKDIVKKVISLQTDEEIMEMASLDNRRLVLNEYLIKAIYEWYLRLFYSSITKKENQAFMPTLNSMVLITSGFRGEMHAGNFFNNGLPYISPMINKISQDISIIKEGMLPKSWTSNHPSALGKICPISVSAQNMGSNIVATNNARVNYYGRFEK